MQNMYYFYMFFSSNFDQHAAKTSRWPPTLDQPRTEPIEDKGITTVCKLFIFIWYKTFHFSKIYICLLKILIYIIFCHEITFLPLFLTPTKW